MTELPEIEKLKAENEKLRAILSRILTNSDVIEKDYRDNLKKIWERLCEKTEEKKAT